MVLIGPLREGFKTPTTLHIDRQPSFARSLTLALPCRMKLRMVLELFGRKTRILLSPAFAMKCVSTISGGFDS